jgi:hypothetical protein
MVGVVKVDSDESHLGRVLRLGRALKDAEKKFDLFIKKGKSTWSMRTFDPSESPITITAIIHKESLESRWARALDMIRDQYGLEIEWERGEITEERPLTQAISNWIETKRDKTRGTYSTDPFFKWAEQYLRQKVPPVEERKSQLLKLKKDGVCFNVEIYHDDNSDD